MWVKKAQTKVQGDGRKVQRENLILLTILPNEYTKQSGLLGDVVKETGHIDVLR